MARQSHKMIILTVRFFTNNLEEDGGILSRHAWDKGAMAVQTNELHDLPSCGPVHFRSLAEILPLMEKLLIKAGVTLHHQGPTEKLYER